jgi:PAS domain-containing protein
MSKAMEACLLHIIVVAAEQHVKRLVQALEQGEDFEQVVARVQAVSRACFAPVLTAMLESRRAESEEGKACPQCGQKMGDKGEQERGMITPLGNVRWRRRYYYCKPCGQGHYPLDERWGIGAGQFTEAYPAGMTLLGASSSYGMASQLFERLTGVSVSDREVGRTTVERGRCLEEERLREQQVWLEQGPPAHSQAASRPWGCSLDAAKVRFRDGWHEVKGGIVYPLTGQQRQSYVVEVGSMEQAGQKLYAEVVRRGADPGRERMVCIADGAPPNWAQFEAHFAQREEILDWYHATQHLWAAAHGVYGEGTAEAATWEKQAESALWAGHPQEVLALLNLAAQQPKGQAAADERHYFDVNQSRMRYQLYREQGYPIGSGRMESACKQTIIARARQAGMSWSKEGLQPVLTLRAELLSGRFDQAWSLTRPSKAA